MKNYKEYLFPMGESHTCDEHSLLFANLVNSACETDTADVENVLKDPENDIVLYVFTSRELFHD